MKSLVTGCAGFIGSNLVDSLLEKGHEVIGIDNFTDYYSKDLKKQNISNALKNDRFILVEKDIMEFKEFYDVDFIFHLAAQAGVRASWGNNFSVYSRNNIDVTQKLLEFYKNSKVKKFVYSSSSSIYGDVQTPMSEDYVPKPISPYGVSKLAAENLCYLYWKSYGIPTVSLRYFTVYGPRQRPDMAIFKFINAIKNSKELNLYGDGEQKRDFTFIGDVVNANLLAASSDLKGEILNIGGGTSITVNDLIKKIEDILSKNANINYMNTQKGDMRDTLAKLEKTQSLLGWKPRVNIDEGLKYTAEWFEINKINEHIH